MKYKTAELDGVLLDTAVAKGRGVEPGAEYSSDWSHAGPIIERERVSIGCPVKGPWRGMVYSDGYRYADGFTPLIAAMRAYVVSKFGDEVELP